MTVFFEFPSNSRGAHASPSQVRDEKAGTVTEFFFAESLPGAPVHMRMMAGEQIVMEMQQLRSTHPPR